MIAYVAHYAPMYEGYALADALARAIFGGDLGALLIRFEYGSDLFSRSKMRSPVLAMRHPVRGQEISEDNMTNIYYTTIRGLVTRISSIVQENWTWATAITRMSRD